MKDWLLVIFVLSFSIVFSQTNKRDILIDLSGKSNLSNFYDNGFNLNINPRLGSFIKDDFVLGFGSELQYDKNQLSYMGVTTRYSTCSYTIGPFLRYYFPHSKHAIFWHNIKYFVINCKKMI